MALRRTDVNQEGFDPKHLGLEFRVDLDKPLRRMMITAGVLFGLGAAALWTGAAISAPILQFGGIGLFACTLYLGISAIRLAGFPDFELRIGTDFIRYPRYPLFLHQSIELKYTEITAILIGRQWIPRHPPPLILVTREQRRYKVALGLCPFYWDRGELHARILVRWFAARLEVSDPYLLVASEALLLYGGGAGVVLVEFQWGVRVLGVVDAASDYADLIAEGTIPSDAKFVVPALRTTPAGSKVALEDLITSIRSIQRATGRSKRLTKGEMSWAPGREPNAN